MKNPHALANTLTAYALIAENSHIDDAVDQHCDGLVVVRGQPRLEVARRQGRRVRELARRRAPPQII